MIFLAAAYTTVADTLTSVADSAGNTWAAAFDNNNTTGIGMGLDYALNTTVDLPVGGTITATLVGTGTSTTSAFCVQGIGVLSALDISNQVSTGLAATSATTVNTGTLNFNNELVIGILATATSGAGYAPGGSFVTQGTVDTDIPSINFGTQVVGTNASVASSPTWTGASNYVSDVVTFKGVAVGGASAMVLGIGQ